MAHPDELLVPGEQVILHRHPHWKMLVVPVLVFLVTVGVAVYLAALVRGQPWARYGWLGLVVLAAALVGRLTVAPLIRWRTTHLAVTTHRVLVREGLLSRRGMDVPVSRIDTVQFRRTLVERLLGCGTLVISSASDETLEFDDVPGVEHVYAMLYREVDEA